MSYSGQYAIAGVQNTLENNVTVAGGGIFLSVDFCNTWEKIEQLNLKNYWPDVSNPQETNTDLDEYRCYVVRMSDSGQFSSMIAGIGSSLLSGVILVSQSYGKNWFIAYSENIGQYAITSLTMTNTGQFQMAGTSTGYIIYSSDYGSTWRKSDTNFVINNSPNGTGQYLSGSMSSYNDKMY